MLKHINTFFTEKKGMRRISKAVMLGLTFFATYRIFMNMPDVNAAVAACYSTLVVGTAGCIWKYMEQRKDNE